MTRVLFFGQLREQLKCQQIDFTLDSEVTVTELKAQLLLAHPDWNDLMQEGLLCAVNQTLCSTQQRVKNGDEVAFFPAVTGG